MAQKIGIEVELGVNAGSAQAGIKQAIQGVDELREALKSATEAGNFSDAAFITKSIDNIESANQRMMQMQMQQDAQQERRERQQMMSKMGANTGAQIGNTISGMASSAAGVVSSAAGGNYAQAAIQGVHGASSAVRNVGSALTGAGHGTAGNIIGGLGTIGSVIGSVMQAGNALSQAYEQRMPVMGRFNRFYAGVGASATERELNNYNVAGGAARGTGMSTEDFLSLASNEARYGVARNRDDAFSRARQAALVGFATNVDAERLQGFAGVASRYGGERNALATAYSGLKASGMEKGQFDEFLVGLQKVMEDGIAKGYMRTSEEIAANFTMFSKLSGGNEMWKGEQGANRVMTMNSGLAGAAGLQSSTDVLAFKAAQDMLNAEGLSDKERAAMMGYKGTEKGLEDIRGTYLEAQLALEKGVSPELMKNIFETVRGSEGQDATGIIEQFQAMFSLNRKGATDVYLMMKNAEAGGNPDFNAVSADMEKLLKDQNNKNNETRLQDTLNDLNQTMVNFGAKAFEVKIGGLGKIERLVEGIYGALIGDKLAQAYNILEGGIGGDFKGLSKDILLDSAATEALNAQGSDDMKALRDSNILNWNKNFDSPDDYVNSMLGEIGRVGGAKEFIDTYGNSYTDSLMRTAYRANNEDTMNAARSLALGNGNAGQEAIDSFILNTLNAAAGTGKIEDARAELSRLVERKDFASAYMTAAQSDGEISKASLEEIVRLMEKYIFVTREVGGNTDTKIAELTDSITKTGVVVYDGGTL